MNVYDLNKSAWDHAVGQGTNPYTQVISSEKIAAARQDHWELRLSDQKPVPKTWFPQLSGLNVLCLASGGGQQAPIFAALGANVTLLDASPKQLAQDAFVAQREGLEIELVQGDMADLSIFANGRFSLIFNPPSTLFVPNLQPIWRECARVLQSGGVLMTGFMNPDEFVFDHVALDEEEKFVVKYGLPYIEYETLTPEARQQRIEDKEMFHFSHTLEGQLGGLINAGFVLTGFYEDRRPDEDGNPIRHFMPSYFIACARKTA